MQDLKTKLVGTYFGGYFKEEKVEKHSVRIFLGDDAAPDTASYWTLDPGTDHSQKNALSWEIAGPNLVLYLLRGHGNNLCLTLSMDTQLALHKLSNELLVGNNVSFYKLTPVKGEILENVTSLDLEHFDLLNDE